MNEKRFRFITDFKPATFVDLETGKHYTCIEVADLLNEMSDENRQLRKEKEDLQKYINKVEDDYHGYYGMTLRNSEWFQ